MKDEAEAALIRSYRGTIESYRRLVTTAEELVKAQRGQRSFSASDLDSIQSQLANGREHVEKIDRYLVLWPSGEDAITPRLPYFFFQM